VTAGATAAPRLGRPAPWATTVDRLALPALLLLAAIMRLPDLATRGTWDADQGHDMLVLRLLVRDGIVPLLGPPTSIGDVHHGAWYYYLLSPAAAVTGGDSPLAVVGLIALAGIAAVGVVWWLARSVGGPLAGLVAGLVMAVSTAAIDESTFIWNPNLIALSSAVALAGAWRAWSGGDRRWWLVAAVGTAVTMQCHVLGVALLPIVGVPFLLDRRRRPMGAVPWVVLAVFVVAYLPLAINELTSGLSETHAALDYLAGGRSGVETAIPFRLGIVALRVVSWPLTGLITDGFVAGSLALVTVVAIVVALGWLRPRHPDAVGATGTGATGTGVTGGGSGASAETLAVRWLGLGLAWSALFLAIAAPSLAAVVRGLPNDHYHAFADPMVFVLVGLGVARVAAPGRVGAGGSARRAGPGTLLVLASIIALIVLVAWNLAHRPPPIHPDGGFPAGAIAATRVEQALAAGGAAPGDVARIRSLPDFKSTEAMVYPLARLGRTYIADTPKGFAPGGLTPTGPAAPSPVAGLVLLCDDLFRDSLGAACGGPAESAVAGDAGGPDWGPLIDRFEAAPGRFVSVYGRGPS
jgi:4-amino-4-deoxy-L-arabinose transferase-like glycosyltransferase